jgi:predicted anti-sigma-YlaC factor YlaD
MISQHVHTHDLARLLRQEFRGPNAGLAEVLIELHLEVCSDCRMAFNAIRAQVNEIAEDHELEAIGHAA